MDEDRGQYFNMSLATLQRIDDILKALHEANIEGHIQKIQKNLLCLFKEEAPFFIEKELKKFDNKWSEINKNGATLDANDNITYGENLPGLLNAFEFDLRIELHKKGLLMAKGENKEFVI